MKFTIEDNLKRVINYSSQNGESVVYDKFEGFNVVEDENKPNELLIYFKDINKDLSVVQRYYIINRSELPSLKEIYNLYKDKPKEIYDRMLSLKNDINNRDDMENVYNKNKLFFISINISLKDWFQFHGLEE